VTDNRKDTCLLKISPFPVNYKYVMCFFNLGLGFTNIRLTDSVVKTWKGKALTHLPEALAYFPGASVAMKHV